MRVVVTPTSLVEELSRPPQELPRPSGSPLAGRSSWIGSLAAFVVLATVTAIVSIVFWPGHMNLDTLDELRQAQTGHYNDWHTPVLSAMWRLLLLVGLHDPGWVLAGSVLALLIGFYLLLRLRLTRPWAVLAAVLVFVFPPVLAFDVELGTDAWFASAIVCGFGLASRCARTRGASRAVSAALAVACAFVAQAARPTAAPAILALLCAVVLVTLAARLQGWRRLLGTATAGTAATLLVVASVLGLQRLVLHAAELHPEQVTYEDDLVALSIDEQQVLVPPDVYTRQDLAYLEEFTSPSRVVNIAPLLFGEHAAIPIPVKGEKLRSLQQAWLAAIRKYPYGYLRVRLHSALWQLGIIGVPDIVYYGSPQIPAWPPGSGFRAAFPSLHNAAVAYVAIGTTSDVLGNHGGPLHRAWIYVLVLVCVTVASLRVRHQTDAILALVSIALLTYAAEILLLSPGVTYRYMHPVIATGTVLLVVLAAAAVRWGQAKLRMVN